MTLKSFSLPLFALALLSILGIKSHPTLKPVVSKTPSAIMRYAPTLKITPKPTPRKTSTPTPKPKTSTKAKATPIPKHTTTPPPGWSPLPSGVPSYLP